MLRAILVACAIVVAACVVTALVFSAQPRQPRLYDEIYAPLNIPAGIECHEGERIVTDDSSGLIVSGCAQQ